MAVETHGPLSVSSVSFLVDLGRKISERTGEPLEVQFLFQRISVLIQRFNSVFFHESYYYNRSFVRPRLVPDVSYPNVFVTRCFVPNVS